MPPEIICPFCNSLLNVTKDGEFIRYFCAKCNIPFYVYFPVRKHAKTDILNVERGTFLAVLFAFIIIGISELILNFILFV